MVFEELNQYRSVEELSNHETNLRSERAALHAEYDGLPFPMEQGEKFAQFTETIEEIGRRKAELQARAALVADAGTDPKRIERVADEAIRSMPRATSRERDIYDLSSLRSLPTEEAANRELHDRAKRANELASFSHTDRSEAQAKAERLLDNDTEDGKIAKRFLLTGSPTYQRAFFKTLAQRPLTNEEAQAIGSVRALSLTGASGGFAVPFDLDPTIIPTSNGAVNPIRQIARVIPITGDEWRGVSSGAITTAYAAEATETTDNAPTLAQPTISTEKAQAFVPFSIEIDMDWSGMRAEMSQLLAESKSDLENTKFALGSGTNEPAGVITGATTTVNATTGQTTDAEDFYRLTAALPERYQSNASIVANRAIFNLIRQFNLTGQSNPWKDLDDATVRDGQAGFLLGYPAYHSSAMAAVTTTGSLFAIVGDFSRFVIVDRVGLNVEVLPHLLGANRRPTGERGLYAFWRNGSKVINADAFRVLIGIV